MKFFLRPRYFLPRLYKLFHISLFIACDLLLQRFLLRLRCFHRLAAFPKRFLGDIQILIHLFFPLFQLFDLLLRFRFLRKFQFTTHLHSLLLCICFIPLRHKELILSLLLFLLKLFLHLLQFRNLCFQLLLICHCFFSYFQIFP